MIRIEKSDVWRRFGPSYRDRGDPVIDLAGCVEIDKARLLFSKTLIGKDSPALQTGRSGDALIDVMSDWMFDAVKANPNIHVLGWHNLGPLDILCLTSEIHASFNKVIWGYLEYGESSDFGRIELKNAVEKMKFHFYLREDMA